MNSLFRISVIVYLQRVDGSLADFCNTIVKGGRILTISGLMHCKMSGDLANKKTASRRSVLFEIRLAPIDPGQIRQVTDDGEILDLRNRHRNSR